MIMRLDAYGYIISNEVYEDIRVKVGDDSIVEYIPLGEVDWIDHSINWSTGEAAIYVATFESYSGENTMFDWVENKYVIESGNAVAEPKDNPVPPESPY